jgi:hypothetical protein
MSKKDFFYRLVSLGGNSMLLKAYLILFVLIVPSVTWSQELCPPPKAVSPEQAPELMMNDSDFTVPEAMNSLDWLENKSWDVIKRFKTTNELLNCTECFGIPFPNSVTKVKGTLLKQTALLERERLEVAKLKLKAGSGNKSDVAAAQERFDRARKDYCAFMEKAEYVD